MTVNVTCATCDGRRLCSACRAADRALRAAGHRVEHSPRYDALRAAANGTYGFEACVIPVRAGEQAVLDALAALLPSKRVAVVVDGGSTPGGLPAHFAVVDRAEYEAGSFSTAWLAARVAESPPLVGQPHEPAEARDGEGAVVVPETGDRPRATRRMRTFASAARAAMAAPAGRLDLLAVLDDELLWAQAGGIGFGLVLVHLPGLGRRLLENGPAAADAGFDRVAAVLRASVRRSDAVAHRNDDFLVILTEADANGTAACAGRIAAAFAAQPPGAGAFRRKARSMRGWGIGTAVCPDDGLAREALLARAATSLRALGSQPNCLS